MTPRLPLVCLSARQGSPRTRPEPLGSVLLDATQTPRRRSAERTAARSSLQPGHGTVSLGGMRPAYFGKGARVQTPNFQLLEPRGPSRALVLETRKLHAAVTQGSTTEVLASLRRGANVELSEFGGLTALHKAAFRGDVETCRLLLAQLAAVGQRDSSGQTPLHAAALQLRPDIVLLLLRRRAEVDAQDHEGVTPARAATGRCHRRMDDARRVAMCLEHLTRAYDRRLQALRAASPSHLGATLGPEACDPEADAQRPMFGRLVLEEPRPAWASSSSRCSGEPSLKSVSTAVASCEAAACEESGRVGSPRSELSRTATPSSRGQSMHATGGSRGSRYVLASSDGLGASHEDPMAVMPPLIRAALRGDADQVRAMLRQRANHHVSDGMGATALHMAAVAAQPAIVSLLLRQRADAAAPNKEGLTPLRCAVSGLHVVDVTTADLRRIALTLDTLLTAQEKEIQRLQQEVSLSRVAVQDSSGWRCGAEAREEAPAAAAAEASPQAQRGSRGLGQAQHAWCGTATSSDPSASVAGRQAVH